MNHQDTKTPRPEIPKETDLVATKIVDAAFKVHSTLGPGLLESVYQACLAHEFAKRGLSFQQHLRLPIVYDGVHLESGFELDFLVESCVVVELKAVESMIPVFKAQTLTYLKLTGQRLGLLINFNVSLIKDGITRLAL